MLTTTAQVGDRWLARFCLFVAAACFIPATRADAAVPFTVLCVAAIFFSVRSLRNAGAPATGRVTVDASKVWFDRDWVDRTDIVGGYWSPGAGRRGSGVVLVGKDEREVAWVATKDRAGGGRFLEHLGVGPTKRIVQLDAVSVTLLPATIRVGADGVSVGTRDDARFVAWSEVEKITKSKRGAVVELTSGEAVELRLAVRSIRGEPLRLAQAGLVSVCRDALFAARTSDAAPTMSVQVARNGRAHDAWVSRLLSPAESFREAPLRPEDLWRVVESPAAEPTARAGAAAVLARTATDDEKTRLRIAAETCAEPRLRVALDLAANGAEATETLRSVEGLDEREVHGRR